jgi:broad specificity phosphatase PhoE
MLAAKVLADCGIDRLYCSPFRRTLETAQIIGEVTGHQPHIWVGLHEWGGVAEERDGSGWVDLPGMNRLEMTSLCPNVVLSDDVLDGGWWFHSWKGIEAMFDEAYERANHVTQALRSRHGENETRLALVGHGGFGSTLVDVLLGLPMCAYDRFQQNNCGISKIYDRTIEGLGNQPTLGYLNNVGHLPLDARTW